MIDGWRMYGALAVGAIIVIAAVAAVFLVRTGNGNQPLFDRPPVEYPHPSSIAVAQGLSIEVQTGRPASGQFVPDFDRELPEQRVLAPSTQSLALGLFDEVPYSAKSHVTVRYGASIVEERVGSLSVGSTYLLPYDETVVVGAEGLAEPIVADRFQLTLAGESAALPAFAVILERVDGSSFVYSYRIDRDEVSATITRSIVAFSQVAPIAESAASLMFHDITQPQSRDGISFFDIELPDNTVEITNMYLLFDAEIDSTIEVLFAGLVLERPADDLVQVHLSGLGSDGRIRLELTTPEGQTTTVQPNSEGMLLFARPDSPLFRARFLSDNNVHYFPSGRWISRSQILPDHVVLSPDHVNHGGELNDYASWQRSVRRSRLQSRYTEQYAPHTRAWWTGAANKMTRFRSEYFHNNIGFHDIDVLWANNEQCEVGFYIGESSVEARQMRLYERSATLMSENLSLEAGHCVIVHTMAAGKSFQSYEDILRLHMDYAPDFMIFEASSSIFFYVTPTIAEAFFGFASGRSPVAAFDLDENGELVYVPPAGDWIEHTVTARSMLPSGAPLSTAFLLPEDHTPPEANRAWEVLGQVIDQYRAEFPETEFYIDATYERARCAASNTCAPTQMTSATTQGSVWGGVDVFYDRLQRLCAARSMTCTDASNGHAEGVFRDPLLYENDFHFNAFGNFWVAEQVARDISADRFAH